MRSTVSPSVVGVVRGSVFDSGQCHLEVLTTEQLALEAGFTHTSSGRHAAGVVLGGRHKGADKERAEEQIAERR